MPKFSTTQKITAADLTSTPDIQIVACNPKDTPGNNFKQLSFVELQSAIAPSTPKWKKVTAFQNGWTNNDVATFGELCYCKDSLGFVRIEGVIKGGAANSVVFTIDDATCRPKKAISRTTHGQNGAGYGIVVGTDGNVTLFTVAGYTPPSTWVAISCSFPSDQVFF